MKLNQLGYSCCAIGIAPTLEAAALLGRIEPTRRTIDVLGAYWRRQLERFCRWAR